MRFPALPLSRSWVQFASWVLKGHLLRLRHAYPLSASESGYDRLHAMREKVWDEVLVLRKRPGNECGEWNDENAQTRDHVRHGITFYYKTENSWYGSPFPWSDLFFDREGTLSEVCLEAYSLVPPSNFNRRRVSRLISLLPILTTIIISDWRKVVFSGNVAIGPAW